MNVYCDLSYHLLAYFGWIMYHGVEGSNFNVVGVTNWIPRHVQRCFDEEKLFCWSVLVISWSVLIRRYQFLGFFAVIEVVGRGVRKYELWGIPASYMFIHGFDIKDQFLSIIWTDFGAVERHRYQILKKQRGESQSSTGGTGRCQAL